MGNGELLGQLERMPGVTCDGLAFHPGGVAIFPAVSCYRKQSKAPATMGLGLKSFILLTFQRVTPLVTVCYRNQDNFCDMSADFSLTTLL